MIEMKFDQIKASMFIILKSKQCFLLVRHKEIENIEGTKKFWGRNLWWLNKSVKSMRGLYIL